MRRLLLALSLLVLFFFLIPARHGGIVAEDTKRIVVGPPAEFGSDKVNWREKNESYWREVLSPEQIRVCRQAGTERPYSGEYATSKKPGVYLCSSCGLPLFSSDAKYESGTGWPSFFQPINPQAVDLRDDSSWYMTRTEVRCSRCGAHLGHVFNDGPEPTGKRYCMNSVCLALKQPNT